VANQRQAAVLGLGRFGQAVAREHTRLGHEVLAVDRSERIVQDLADEVTHAVRADITDGDTLRELGIGDFDIVIIGVSDNLEVSILTTVQVKRLGAKRVLAKAADDLHGLILEQVGADRVIYPEQETGIRVAHTYAAGGIRGYLDVAPGYGIARVLIDKQFIGRTLGDINFSRTYGVTVIALYRGGTVTLNPVSTETLQRGDNLIVAGLDEDLERLPGSL